jgi:hypothetical protein
MMIGWGVEPPTKIDLSLIPFLNKEGTKGVVD